MDNSQDTLADQFLEKAGMLIEALPFMRRYSDKTLVVKFGGHAMAAGMSIELQHYEAFAAAFDQVVRQQLSEDDLQAVVHSDGELTAAELNLQFAEMLRNAGPWGQHFPEPVFDGVFNLLQQRIVGEKHLKMLLSSDDNPQQVIDAIAFNINNKQWPDNSVKKVRVVYKLDVNEFRGQQTVQLLVDELEPIL